MLNPALSGLAVWFTYLLGKRLKDETLGLLGAGLTLTSPFFWINSGNLLSHPFGLILTIAFVLFWIDNFSDEAPKWHKSVVLGLTLGTLALTRPFTAMAISLPFFLDGVRLLWRGNSWQRAHVVAVGVITVLIGLLHLVWQWRVTGDPFINPYTLWWPYDKVGFGPDVGLQGNTLLDGLNATYVSLYAGAGDLFGWWRISWVFIPLGLWAFRKSPQARLAASPLLMLVIAYSAYWVGAWLYGPRYYYESLYAATLLSAAGILFIWDLKDIYRSALVLGLAVLVVYNLAVYLPQRLNEMRGLYGISREQIERWELSHIEPNYSLFIVYADPWTEYGAFLELQDPWLHDVCLFATSQNPVNDRPLIDYYTKEGRFVYGLDPDNPDELILLGTPASP